MIAHVIAAVPTYLDLTAVVEVILFLLFLAALNVLFYQPLSRIFDERSARVEAGERAAEESRRRAEETRQEVERQLTQARSEAQGIIASANRDAAAQRQTLMQQAQGEADARIEQAREEIRQERMAAVAQLRRESSALAILVASRVAGRSLDTPANQELADRAIAAESGVG